MTSTAIKRKKTQALNILKQKSRDINAQIDTIVLQGGIVGLGDPLMSRLRAVHQEIRKLSNH